jgi:HEAT repeat protein
MIEEFLKLSPTGQLKYLKGEQFAGLDRETRIEFLKELALGNRCSSKCLASALKILRELKFRDRVFYKRFLEHSDSSVIMACKKALSDKSPDMGFVPMREMVKRQNNEKKLQTVRLIVSETGQAGENLLLSFLAEDNIRVRELVVKELSGREQLDEGKLLAQLPHAIWYTRAAIVEVLGNRRSRLLLGRAEELMADPNVEVRLQLLIALSKLERGQVKDLLSRLTNDPHVRVSKEARRILSTI